MVDFDRWYNSAAAYEKFAGLEEEVDNRVDLDYDKWIDNQKEADNEKIQS